MTYVYYIIIAWILCRLSDSVGEPLTSESEPKLTTTVNVYLERLIPFIECMFKLPLHIVLRIETGTTYFHS